MSRKQQLATRSAVSPVGVMPRRRAGSCARNDKHEQQADRAADRVLHGEKNVARMLTPAPTAHYRAGSSHASPLPAGIRGELEESFGVELSAVRLHTDAAAAAAARAEEAAAFTAGADIYFSAGAYAPQTVAGGELLAHEIAHVVQQTGRPGYGSRLRATRATGTGPIQRQTFTELRILHEPTDAKDKAAYDAMLKELREELKKPDPAAAATAFAKANKVKVRDWPEQAESLLYDTLKLLEQYDEAVALLERGNFTGGKRIQTAWGSKRINTLLEEHNGAGVYGVAIAKHPVLTAYWEEYLRLVEVYIFRRPDKEVPPLFRKGSSEKIGDHLVRLEKNFSDVTDLSDNEWMFGGLMMMNVLDLDRYSAMTAIDGLTAQKRFTIPIFAQRFRAEKVREWGTGLKDFKFVKADGTADDSRQEIWGDTYQRLGDRLEEIGGRALEQWDRAMALQEARVAFFKNKKVEGEEEETDPIKDSKAAVTVAKKIGLDKFVLDAIKKLRERGKAGASVPEASEYADRANKLADNIDKFTSDKLQGQQAALFHQKKTEDEVAVIWLTIWMGFFAGSLREIGGTTQQGTRAAESLDARIADRLRKARAILRLADALGWPKVVKECNEVLHAKAETQSEFAILKDWERQSVPVELLIEDFSDFPFEGYGPFGPRELSAFYQARYYEELSGQLLATLPKTAAEERQWVDEATKKTPYLMNEAEAQVKATLVRPVRYVIDADNFELALKEGDTKFDVVVMRHPKTQALVAEQKKQGMRQVLPTNFNGRVYVWFLPALVDLVTWIRKIDVVKAAVAAVVPDHETMTNDEWLAAISRYLLPIYGSGGRFPAEAGALRAAIRSVLLGRKYTAWDTLLPQMQAALRVDREVLARRGREALQLYADDHLWYYDAPNKLIDSILNFSAAVVPETDRPLQVAALILELSNKFGAAFGSERRFDVINGLLGWLERAQEVGETRAPELLREQPAALLPDDERTSAWIAARVALLHPIIERFRSVRSGVQTRFGFKADAAKNQLLSMVYAEEIKPGMEMGGDYGSYKLIEVKRSFVYHPPYGSTPYNAEMAPTGYSPAQLRDENDKTDLNLDPSEVLLVVEIGGVATNITANLDDLVLKDLATAVEGKAFALGMESLAWLCQKYMELLMDAAELVPGYGLAVTGVRLMESVALFYEEGGYDAVKELIKNGTQEYLERLWREIKDSVDPEHLWTLLLFGDERLDAVMERLSTWGGGDSTPSKASGKGAGKKRGGGTTKGKFGGVRRSIEGFRKLGKALFKAWMKLHDRVQEPMDDFRTYCSTRPVLAFVFGFIADHVAEIMSLAEKAFALAVDDKSPTLSLDFKTMISEQQKKLVDRVHGLLATLEEFELPESIMDMKPIYQFVIDELILFVIGRLGMKGKVVRLVLKETGALSLVTSKVASELVKAGVDPNDYWRDELVPLIRDQFNDARDMLVEEIHERLQAPVFGGLFDNITKAPALTTIPLTASEFTETKPEGPPPETQLQPRAGGLPRAPATVPPISGGAPLDPDVRAVAERRFGHDFGHVRMHTRADAEALTRRFAADALTTGSHIFLRPGVSPEHAPGERVLNHELTHVLQQTGPRPLGGPHDGQPVAGSPGVGLRWDQALETAADRVAALVTGRSGGLPVPISPGSAAGLQPALNMNPFTIAKLLRTVSDIDAVKKRQTDVDALLKTSKKPKKLADADVAAGVKATVDAIADAKKIVEGSRVFKSELGSVLTQLKNHADAIELAAYQIASTAVVHVTKPASEKGKAKEKGKTIELFQPGHFARELEGYILGRAGIVVSFDYSVGKKDVEGEKFEYIKDVNAVKVLHIHLPYIDGRSNLWVNVMTNTWPGADEAKRAKLREAARGYLTNKISATVFALFGEKYKFSIITEKKVEELQKTAGGGALPASELPDWNDYVETEPSKGKRHPTHGHIGLRLATYGDPSQKSTGRESHHLTQYLLADYFANGNDVKAFRPGRRWPGVRTGAGGIVDRVEAPGREPIAIGKTRGSARGEKMPSLSLAASTHRGGSLHITPAPDDIKGETQKTQGHAVNNSFDRNLPLPLRAESSKTDHDAFLKKSDDDAREGIYLAVQHTYKEVRKHMADRLKAALPEYELAYYKALADNNAARKLSTTDEAKLHQKLKEVAAKAEEHNKTGMEAFGWKTGV